MGRIYSSSFCSYNSPFFHNHQVISRPKFLKGGIMKNLLNILCAVLVVLIFPLSAFTAEDEPRLITVTADAEVRVVPDEVIITLGVETWNKNLTAAKKENDEIVKKIVAMASKYTREEKHVQTDYINIDPRSNGLGEQQSFIGYFVRKSIVIILKDLSKFEEVLSNAIGAGANHVHGVQFRTTELQEYKEQARTLAIKAAEKKAKDLAEELGQSIGKPYAIREEQIDSWAWYNNWWSSRSAIGRMSQNLMQDVRESAEPGTTNAIELGQINVNARVTVSFELE